MDNHTDLFIRVASNTRYTNPYASFVLAEPRPLNAVGLDTFRSIISHFISEIYTDILPDNYIATSVLHVDKPEMPHAHVFCGQVLVPQMCSIPLYSHRQDITFLRGLQDNINDDYSLVNPNSPSRIDFIDRARQSASRDEHELFTAIEAIVGDAYMTGESTSRSDIVAHLRSRGFQIEEFQSGIAVTKNQTRIYLDGRKYKANFCVESIHAIAMRDPIKGSTYAELRKQRSAHFRGLRKHNPPLPVVSSISHSNNFVRAIHGFCLAPGMDSLARSDSKPRDGSPANLTEPGPSHIHGTTPSRSNKASVEQHERVTPLSGPDRGSISEDNSRPRNEGESRELGSPRDTNDGLPALGVTISHGARPGGMGAAQIETAFQAINELHRRIVQQHDQLSSEALSTRVDRILEEPRRIVEAGIRALTNAPLNRSAADLATLSASVLYGRSHGKPGARGTADTPGNEKQELADEHDIDL